MFTTPLNKICQNWKVRAAWSYSLVIIWHTWEKNRVSVLLDKMFYPLFLEGHIGIYLTIQ